MRLRRSLQVAVVLAALVSPLAAFAATVTTAPVDQPAPALAMPMLVVLAIILIGLGAYRLRSRGAGVVAAFALVAGLSLVAGFSYATLPVVDIEGADCNAQTIHTYDDGGATLASLCLNPIKIVAIVCGGAPDVQGDPLPVLCTVGEVLTSGQECLLPGCV